MSCVECGHRTHDGHCGERYVRPFAGWPGVVVEDVCDCGWADLVHDHCYGGDEADA